MSKRLQVSNPKRPRLEVGSVLELIDLLPENNVRLLQNVLGFRTIRVKREDSRQYRSLMLTDLPNHVRPQVLVAIHYRKIAGTDVWLGVVRKFGKQVILPSTDQPGDSKRLNAFNFPCPAKVLLAFLPSNIGKDKQKRGRD